MTHLGAKLSALADGQLSAAQWRTICDLLERHGAIDATFERAVRHALDDDGVAALCGEVVALAREGLTPAERPMLAYAEYVLATRRCGADRMLSTWRHAPAQDAAARLAHVAARHRMQLHS